MFILRESIEAHLAPLQAVLSGPVLWEGDRVEGSHPPHFREVRVAAAERVGAHFMRLRCEGEDLTRYESGGLHFRLLLPTRSERPVWPAVNESGSTVWPDGGDALHMAVYTFRRMGRGWFDFDVYLHGNGKTCAWAERAVGQPAGLLGPGGGEMPEKAGRLLLAGDETALPAIARMLEMRGDDGVKAVVALRDMADRSYCEDARLAYVEPEALQAELDAAVAERPFVWFGGPKADARALKDKLRAVGYARGEMQVQAYW